MSVLEFDAMSQSTKVGILLLELENLFFTVSETVFLDSLLDVLKMPCLELSEIYEKSAGAKT